MLWLDGASSFDSVGFLSGHEKENPHVHVVFIKALLPFYVPQCPSNSSIKADVDITQ